MENSSENQLQLDFFLTARCRISEPPRQKKSFLRVDFFLLDSTSRCPQISFERYSSFNMQWDRIWPGAEHPTLGRNMMLADVRNKKKTGAAPPEPKRSGQSPSGGDLGK